MLLYILFAGAVFFAVEKIEDNGEITNKIKKKESQSKSRYKVLQPRKVKIHRHFPRRCGEMRMKNRFVLITPHKKRIDCQSQVGKRRLTRF
jgi:hypothetical protein